MSAHEFIITSEKGGEQPASKYLAREPEKKHLRLMPREMGGEE